MFGGIDIGSSQQESEPVLKASPMQDKADTETDAVRSSVSIIQFSTAIYYCSEDETQMDVDVVRLGNCSHACSVNYETHDGSARAGQKYEHVAGTLEFGPGETDKMIHIPLLNDDSWDATIEFHIVLSDGTVTLE